MKIKHRGTISHNNSYDKTIVKVVVLDSPGYEVTHQSLLYLHVVVEALASSSTVILWSVKKVFDCTILNGLVPELVQMQ